MRCMYCNKNEAVKSYERMEKGVAKREYYCLACYEKLFLCLQDTESESSLSVCPYCGTTTKEFETRKLVGCPYCYHAMRKAVFPFVLKMQGSDCGHRGKKPLLSEEGEILLGSQTFFTEEEKDEFRMEIVKAERFNRQKQEMEMLIAHLGSQDPVREREYGEKLERMLKTGAVEEEIVW